MLNRRTLLLLLSGLPLVGLSGCGGSRGDSAANCSPRPFAADESCAVCGMTIVEYPGPKGQVCVDDGNRSVGFCSTSDLFAWVLQPENATRIRQAYVHDLMQTEWERPDDSALIVARKAHFVIGDPRMASMGPALVPFGERDAAKAHADELEEGRVLTYEDIDWDVLNDLTQSMIDQQHHNGGGHHGH